MNKVSAEVREKIAKILDDDALIQDDSGQVLVEWHNHHLGLADQILSIPQLAIVDRNATGKATILLGELALEIPVEKIKEQGFVKEIM